MDIERLLRDYGIQFIAEGHKHCREGWLNMPCPFCTGNPGYHLGVSVHQPHFRCWRCGWKPMDIAIAALAGVPREEARKIIRQYKGIAPTAKAAVDARARIGSRLMKLPDGTGPLKAAHKAYLAKRGFDWAMLEEVWEVQGTGQFAELDGLDFKWRLVYPIKWEGRTVSFQTRTIGNAEPKYITAGMARESVHHKDIIYCHPDIDWGRPVVLVEGVTDTWRLGTQSGATFGIEFKAHQVRAVARKKREAGDARVAVLYDDDPQAIIQAQKLHAELSFRGMDALLIEGIQGDPGDLTDSEARRLMAALEMNWCNIRRNKIDLLALMALLP